MIERVEITDLIRSFSASGAPVPVNVDSVTRRLRASGQHHAAAIVEGMPSRGGLLAQRELDRLLLRVHCELMRLAEELQLGRRVLEVLAPWVSQMHSSGPEPVRVVDVGCGVGYVTRWLANNSPWEGMVHYYGVDLDPTLVEFATQQATREGSQARFVCADALEPGRIVEDPPRTIVISTGLLHHMRGVALRGFFEAQAQLQVGAFAHWDPQPGALTTLGAWMFHRSRMREAVSRHDGVLSARRAHSAKVLLESVEGLGYDVACRDRVSITEALRPITGRRSP